MIGDRGSSRGLCVVSLSWIAERSLLNVLTRLPKKFYSEVVISIEISCDVDAHLSEVGV